MTISYPGGSPEHNSARAWLAVVGASLTMLCSVGFLNAFGVFQSYYKEHILSQKSDSDISWIGSFSIFLLYTLAPVSGILVDKFGPAKLLWGGTLGLLIAIFMTSLCQEYYQFFLAQALLLGSSMAFVTWPPLAVVSRHWSHRRGLALGVVIGGSSLGGVIWPIIVDRLLNHHSLSFPWTMRVVGFIMLPCLVFASMVIQEAPKPKPCSDATDDNPGTAPEKPKNTDLSILRSRAFLLLCLGLALAYFGLLVPFFYTPSYAAAQGIPSTLSFDLVSITNGASFLGRVISGIIADRYGPFNVGVMAVALSGIIALCWTSATSSAGLIIWSCAYEFVSGSVMSLQGACAGKIATHESQGTAMGFLMGSVAITSMVGAPIGGALVTSYGYLALSMFTGVSLILGSILFGMARFRLNRRLYLAV